MALAITSITFDKPSYAQGATITATINYTGSGFMFTGSGEMDSGQPAALTAIFAVLPTWTVSDTGSRVWTFVNDSGTAAVFTAVA